MNKEKIFPKVLEVSNVGLFSSITKVEHPFLQALADMKAVIYRDGDGYTLVGNITFAWFWLHPDNVVTLECIATPAGERSKGSGTMIMQAICEAADKTGTTIVLRVTTVKMPEWRIGSVPFAISHGANKQGKIPVRDLPKWYQKFGFVKTHEVKAKGKIDTGIHMERKPQQNLEV